jgi:hypothetical protein
MAARTLQIVERDLRRARRAEKRLRRNLATVLRTIAKEGGVEGEPKKGFPNPSVKPRVSPSLRTLREVTKALKIVTDEIRNLVAEKNALELQVKETTDEYSLD